VARDIETVLQGATAQDAIDLNAGGHMYHI
jgi:hypothetical protein